MLHLRVLAFRIGVATPGAGLGRCDSLGTTTGRVAPEDPHLSAEHFRGQLKTTLGLYRREWSRTQDAFWTLPHHLSSYGPAE